MKDKRIFYCYSRPLKDFLIQNGERYFTSTYHNKTKKKFWIFHGTERLNDLLEKWNKDK